MRMTATNTDELILAELGRRIARSRLERNVGQEELATEAGVSKSTVERLEAGKAVRTPSLIRILRALDLLSRFDQVVPEDLPSPIERLKTQGKRRQRASGKRRLRRKEDDQLGIFPPREDLGRPGRF